MSPLEVIEQMHAKETAARHKKEEEKTMRADKTKTMVGQKKSSFMTAEDDILGDKKRHIFDPFSITSS